MLYILIFIFLDSNLEHKIFCTKYAPASFTPRNYFWCTFLLEAESIPGP
jgi:hypothetical protein